MRYDPEDYERLLRHVADIHINAVIARGVRYGEVFRGRAKDGNIPNCRRDIIERLRATVGETYHVRHRKICIVEPGEAYPPGQGFKPLSYPSIGQLLGLDHTTSLLALRKRKRERQELLDSPVSQSLQSI